MITKGLPLIVALQLAIFVGNVGAVTTTISDQATCQAAPVLGAWNAGLSQCTVGGTVTIAAADEWRVSGGVVLTVSAGSTFNVSGTLAILANAELDIAGLGSDFSVLSGGTIEVGGTAGGAGAFSVETGASLVVLSGGTFNADGVVSALGGLISVRDNAALLVNEAVYITGDGAELFVHPLGELRILNDGLMYVGPGLQSISLLSGTGTVQIDSGGVLTLGARGGAQISGTLTVNGMLQVVALGALNIAGATALTIDQAGILDVQCHAQFSNAAIVNGGGAVELETCLFSEAERDSYLKQGRPNDNYGADELLLVQKNPSVHRTLIEFNRDDILTAHAGQTLTAATLQIFIAENSNQWGPNGRMIDIHRLNKEWTEGDGASGEGVTWNCRSDTDISNSRRNCRGGKWPGGRFARRATDSELIYNGLSGYIFLDVTADVQKYLDGSRQSLGWIIKKRNEAQNGRIAFSSKDANNGNPKLELDFE